MAVAGPRQCLSINARCAQGQSRVTTNLILYPDVSQLRRYSKREGTEVFNVARVVPTRAYRSR
jgi:hypothetical protein